MNYSFKKKLAQILSLLSFSSAIFFVFMLNDNEFLKTSNTNDKDHGAVFVIRDSVPAYQRFFTAYFIKDYLSKYYDAVVYECQESQQGAPKRTMIQLQELLKKYEKVDILIMAHTNQYQKWLTTISPKLRSRIRLVYNSGCTNALQYKEWLGLGISAYVGHKGKISLSPFFFISFLRKWVNGKTLQYAVNSANSLLPIQIAYFDHIVPNDQNICFVHQTKAYMYGHGTTKIDL